MSVKQKKMMMHHQWGTCQVFVAGGFCIVFLHGHRKPSSVVRQNISAGLWSMAQWSLRSKVSMLQLYYSWGASLIVLLGIASLGFRVKFGCSPTVGEPTLVNVTLSLDCGRLGHVWKQSVVFWFGVVPPVYCSSYSKVWCSMLIQIVKSLGYCALFVHFVEWRIPGRRHW